MVAQVQLPKPARTLVFALILVGSVNSVPTLLSKRKLSQKLVVISSKYLNANTIKTALFPSLLPTLYKELQSSSYGQFSELLPSPLLLLLSPRLRVQFTLYFVGAALQSTVQGSRIKRWLPPIWWLNVVSNTWLLWVFLVHSQSFPKEYADLLLEHPRYTSTHLKQEELRRFLATAESWPLLTPENAPENGYAPGHTRLFCATLHPDEPSCTKNYLKAWVVESQKVVKWVSAFGALVTLLRHKRRIIEKPAEALKDWMVYTLRGTIFVVGSVNTAWGLMCPTQRILPPDAIPVARWLIHGSLGSLWILALPRERRVDISMYASRLAVSCAWDVWKRNGGYSIKYGECLLFSAAWSQLTRIRRNGKRINGLVGLWLDFVENAH